MTKAKKVLEYILSQESNIAPSTKAIFSAIPEDIKRDELQVLIFNNYKGDITSLLDELYPVVIEEPVVEEQAVEEPVIEQVVTTEKPEVMSETTQSEVSKGKRPFAALDTVEIKRRLEVYRQALKLDHEDSHILTKIEQLEEELGKPGR